MTDPRVGSLLLCFCLLLGASACDGNHDSKEPDGTGSGATGSGATGSGATGSGATGSGATGSGATGSGGTSPVGCVAPPGDDFDPVPGYTPPALTATDVVTSADDSGPGSLRAVLAEAADDAVIGFDATLAGATITLASTLELTRSVTLDGSGAAGLTLDGADAVRLFQFNGDGPTRIAFYSLRLIRGRTEGSGAAISLNGGDLDFEVGGCTFEDHAGSEGGAIRVGYAKGTDVFIHDSTFRGNDGSVSGGGNGWSGGALSTSGTNLRIARCRFEGNRGPTTGAVYTMGSDPVIEDSVFIDNEASRPDGGSGAFFADGGGGGPDNQTPGQITLTRVRFVGNRGAGDDGGAVEAYAYDADTVTFDGCVFLENEANPGRAGGAFIHANKEVYLLRTAFVDNTATQPGAAIWADGSARYQIENCLFSGNVTTGDLGGALRLNIDEQAELHIASSTFVDNVAADGNGALWLGGERNAHVTNSIFANNTSHSWAQQINFAVSDDGGNLLWPDPETADSTLGGAQIADPALGALEVLDGFEVRVPGDASPALDAAVTPSPGTDLRNAPRDARPDIGAVEVGSACGG